MKHLLLILLLALPVHAGVSVCSVQAMDMNAGTVSQVRETYCLDANLAPIITDHILATSLFAPTYTLNGVTYPSLTIHAGTKLFSDGCAILNGTVIYPGKAGADAILTHAVNQNK